MRRQGFTMIEIVVAVAVVLVLASVAMPVTTRTLRKGAISATKSELAAVGKALLAYAGDYRLTASDVKWGRFPAEQTGLGGASTVLGSDLESDLAGQGWNPVLRQGWNGPYLTAQPERCDADGDGTVDVVRSFQVDAWGRYYRYRNRTPGGGFVTSMSDTRVVTVESGGPDRNLATAGDNVVYEVYTGRAY